MKKIFGQSLMIMMAWSQRSGPRAFWAGGAGAGRFG